LLFAAVVRVEVFVSGVGDQGEPHDADREQRQLVEGYSLTFADISMQGVGNQSGREWQERHHEQGQQVKPREN
jgi:hypothetical protein